MTNWVEIDRLAKLWVKEAGSRIKASMQEGLSIETKSNPNDLVTNIDKETERFFIEKIQSAFSDHHILGEEGQGEEVTSLDGIVWIIDPIDGTMNFVHQKRNFAISIGIFEHGVGQIGLIYDVIHDELYHAVKGEGAYMNDTLLPPLKDVAIEKAVVGINPTWAIESPHFDAKPFARLVRDVRGTRTIGSAALELAYIASGRSDAYVTLRLAPWDYAAGCVLLDEVGAVYSNIHGERLTFLEKNSIVAGNRSVCEKILHDYIKGSGNKK
ncbi:inositol monophosphatase family protein [Bacillus aerius]|uniref:inositol monophosphatase family protein n=1 Tax=Bacillus aerius TaxID=293388 RepID=UPI0028154D60|nr:inositol monophosphatase family protein [Bacillus aerius]WMT27953.1 inositol monophosphatase family protein [Bacillus aerius]